MSINVVNVKKEGTRLVITVEGNTFSDVSSTEAKKAAIDKGTSMIGLCGIGNMSGPYPVDEAGLEITDFAKLAELLKVDENTGLPQGYCRYRNEFTVNQSLGL